MYTLGIETSCDETSCAILKERDVIANITISSLFQHKKYGGIVPEIATRAHLEFIDKVVNQALKQSGISLKKINLVAATCCPGLIGAVVIGLNFAKTLALCLRKPFIGVNHLHAHLFAPFLSKTEKIEFPFIGLVVSGGHTEIYLVKDFNDLKLLGQTVDDACGEVYDKIARYLGIGYPGGPIIDRMFNPQTMKDFTFRCGRSGLDLSFSGIKTAVIYKAEELREKGMLAKKIIGLVSSFQNSVIEAVLSTTLDAAIQAKVTAIAAGGGVMANIFLRQRLKEEAEKRNLKLLLAPKIYSTDNAAMVAGLGFYLYNNKGLKSKLSLKAEAN